MYAIRAARDLWVLLGSQIRPVEKSRPQIFYRNQTKATFERAAAQTQSNVLQNVNSSNLYYYFWTLTCDLMNLPRFYQCSSKNDIPVIRLYSLLFWWRLCHFRLEKLAIEFFSNFIFIARSICCRLHLCAVHHSSRRCFPYFFGRCAFFSQHRMVVFARVYMYIRLGGLGKRFRKNAGIVSDFERAEKTSHLEGGVFCVPL